jgi:surfeit locus 1 family protein
MTPRRSRVVPALATFVAIAVFVTAGNWQRDRMHQKQALAEQLAAAAAAPAQPLPGSETDWSGWRYRVVELTGRFDAGRQILIDNRVHAGRTGYHVVTPLLLDGGRSVLVNRGFVAAGVTRGDRPAAPPPEGTVRVQGRINPSPARYLELGGSGPAGNVWQNLDPMRFAEHTGLPVLPIVVEQLDGPADGLLRDWPRPDAGIDKHRIYMMQWYAFAILAFGLWAGFTFLPRRAR